MCNTLVGSNGVGSKSVRPAFVRTRACVWLGGLCLVLALQSGASRADEYRLQPGDVLEFSVAGIPDIRQKLMVNVDGETSFPLIGELKVAGQTVSAVRQQVQDQLPKRSLNIRTSDGKESITVITGDEITVVIAENRPVYVKGDVGKPGEIPFRPGMSVRQAIALSGGYDVVRFKAENPILASADLRGTYESLWTDYARFDAQILRLRAELEGRKELNRKDLAEVPLASSVVDAVFRNEQDQFAARMADYTREKMHIQAGVKQMDDRLAVLEEQRTKEEEGAAIDTSEIERIGDLQKRGIVPVTRQVETRRLSLLSSTRALQIAELLEKTKKDRQDLARSSQRLDDQRKADLARDLQDATVKLAQTRAQIAAVGEKMLYTGVLKSQLVRDSGGEPSLVVHHRNDKGEDVRIVASEDTLLQPGDTIDVALQVSLDLGGKKS